MKEINRPQGVDLTSNFYRITTLSLGQSFGVVFLCIKTLYELHCLLSTLLSIELSVDEKLGIMEKEYNIPVDDRIRNCA